MSDNSQVSNNPLSTDQDKDSAAFGLNIMKSVYADHLGGFNGESIEQRRRRFDLNRKYFVGEQPTDYLKKNLIIENGVEILPTDIKPTQVQIAIFNRLNDRYIQRQETIRVSAVDPFSQNKKKQAKENDRFKMKYGQHIQDLQQNAGMNLEEFNDTDPKTDQELDVKYAFTYKEREEIIMELGTDIVFYDNDWSKINKPQILRDIETCGFAVVNNELDSSDKIKTPIVKPEEFITSYSEKEDFSDWQWQGQCYSMSIAEIRLRYPKKLNEEKLFDLAKKYSGTSYGNPREFNISWNNSFRDALSRPYDRYNIQVVSLYYKTLGNLTYEKNTDRFGKEILDRKKTVKPNKEYEVSPPYYVAYKGVWVVDSEYLLEWGLAKNMIKPNENLTEIKSPYTVFMPGNIKCKSKPLIETMIPSLRKMELIDAKVWRLIATMMPDGYDIDVTGLSDIDMGQGIGVVTPMQLYDIALQTGNRYYKRTEDDGETQRSPAIMPRQVPLSNKIEQLESQWQKEYAKLQLIIGSNNLDAGNITNQAVANSTLNDARQLSESASNYIYGAYLYIFEKCAKNVQIRLWDKFVYGNGKFEGYVNTVGKDNVEYLKLEATDDFEKTNFDVKIEAVIDDSEMQRLNQRIDLALQAGSITLEDSIMLDFITNPRYKAMMLADRTKKKREEDMKQAALNSQMNQQQAVAGAQAKGQADMQLVAAQHETKMQQIEAERNNSMALEQERAFGLLKNTLITQILSKDGATIKDLPPFVFEGLPQLTAVQQASLAAYMQGLQAESQQQQQAMQQQPQQGQEQQMPEQADEQVAA